MPAGMMQNRDPSMAALSQTFRSVEGVPAPTANPVASGGLSPILAMLQSGQMSAEALLALLSALTGMGVEGMQGPMQGLQGPPQGLPQEAAGGGDIAAALGGY